MVGSDVPFMEGDTVERVRGRPGLGRVACVYFNEDKGRWDVCVRWLRPRYRQHEYTYHAPAQLRKA